VQEIAYVSAPQVILRDRVSAVFSKTGVVKNGDRVQILEREKRFARVRTASGVEGWMEQRSLVPQFVYEGFQQLAQQQQSAPVQAAGTTRNDTNIHLEPGRETEHLYQLNQGSKVDILKRATAEKSVPGAVAKPANPNKNESPKPTAAMEDWWLIRDPDGRVGWVLGRMVDMDVPLEIAQYAEGQRTVAFFVLDQVPDGDKKVSQYLVALSEPKDGLPFDFNQVRVFTWNVKRHRYETALSRTQSEWSLASDGFAGKFRERRNAAGIHTPRERRQRQHKRAQVQNELANCASRPGAGRGKSHICTEKKDPASLDPFSKLLPRQLGAPGLA